MTESEACWVLDGWYRVAHNEGTFSALPHGASRSAGDDDWQRDFDAWAFSLVEKILSEIGKGECAPSELVRLIDYRCKVGDVEGFELFGPDAALQKEIVGLGFRAGDLVQLAYKRLIRRICRENMPKYYEVA